MNNQNQMQEAEKQFRKASVEEKVKTHRSVEQAEEEAMDALTSHLHKNDEGPNQC